MSINETTSEQNKIQMLKGSFNLRLAPKSDEKIHIYIKSNVKTQN